MAQPDVASEPRNDDEPDPLVGPYVERSRADWAALAASTPLDLDARTLGTLRGLRDPTSLEDVREVYLPLTALLTQYVDLTGQLHRSTNDFLRLSVGRTPFVIGVAGSVAVGKSTTARLLQYLLASWPHQPKVELITTDGFLLPNAELERRGIPHRKGFPESYDRRALMRFVIDVKSGKQRVTAPVYSHLVYDIVPGEHIVVTKPDILIVEGLNVLQPARARPDGTTGLAVSDFFDFSVYVDAHHNAVRNWYIQRFMALRDTAFRDPRSFFTRFAAMGETEALATARQIWDSINGPNLAMNIKPTRARATAVLRKDADHRVEWVRIRKL
ncbi:MAG: type I pantothenate kinase [Propionibacteriaceae bacterium]